VAGFRHEDRRSADVEQAAADLSARVLLEQTRCHPESRDKRLVTRSKKMSLLTIAVVNAVLAGAILGALAVVSWLPFVFDRSDSSVAGTPAESVPLAA
jgi:hypothetical protein